MVTQRGRDIPGIDHGRPTMNHASLVPRRLLRRAEASEYVQERWGYPLSPPTLAKLACVGGGPTFRRASRFPLYEIKDLDAWVGAKLTRPVRSTSEYPEAAPK
jgi:hypothetical protein